MYPNGRNKKTQPRCIAIMGATATGKSQLAINIARHIGGEIISIDSRQVYRGMDIGTAKVLPAEQEGIPHHLLDIMNPDETNSAGKHAALARDAIYEICARSRVPILAGGTGLYFRAIFRGLMDLELDDDSLQEIRVAFTNRSTANLYLELEKIDPARAQELSPNDRMRIARALEIYLITGMPMSDHIREQASNQELDTLKIFLTMPRFDLRDRIARRTHAMFRAGWIDEVAALLAAGYDSAAPGMISLGYQEIATALEQDRDPRQDIETIITHTRQYAKRQETFFRSEQDAVLADVTLPTFEKRLLELVRERHYFKNNLT